MAKKKKSKPLFIDWCSKDALDGMIQLDIYEELAYRRILDLIVSANNRLEDASDEKLGIMTKLGAARWRKARPRLFEVPNDDEEPKLYLATEGGRTYIRNARMDEEIEAARGRIAKASGAGKASAEKRAENGKPLEDNETGSTHVADQAPTPGQPDGQPTIQPSTHAEDSPSEANASSPPRGGGAGKALTVRPAEQGDLLPGTKPKKENARGTRLARDWLPAPDTLRWAVAQGLTYDTAVAIAEQFRDYWVAQPGKNACKLDWPATWRNWIREHIRRHGTGPWPRNGGSGPHGHRPSVGSASAAARALLSQDSDQEPGDGGDGVENANHRLRVVGGSERG